MNHARETMGMRRGIRNGFALPVAVFALVIIGVLVTGGFYIARQETRIGIASTNSQRAFYLAERGIYSTLAAWDNAAMSAPAAWDSTTLNGSGTGGTWAVSIMPMTSRLFFLTSTGTVTDGGALWSGATRQVGLMTRIRTVEMEPQGALTIAGDLVLGGNAVIDGRDFDPPEWPGLCDAPNDDKPGILASDTSSISIQGNESRFRANQLFGSADLAEDPSITPASLTVFGEMTWDDLTQLADKKYNSSPSSPAPVSNNGVCATSSLYNWGEPLLPSDPCFTFFPIIHLNNPNQTWTMSGGTGQGILLVEGDLRVTGDLTFYGLIYIKGQLQLAGGGTTSHFYGGTVVADENDLGTSVLGTADVIYSSCAIERALVGNLSLTQSRPLVDRSWVDLSSVIY
jgi:hypothetical protein